jgi:hypothetical protein
MMGTVGKKYYRPYFGMMNWMLVNVWLLVFE